MGVKMKLEKNEEKIKKLEKVLENLTDLYYDTNEILGTDDNDASRGISCAESCVIDEIDYLKKTVNCHITDTVSK